jgi:hypothetical protein
VAAARAAAAARVAVVEAHQVVAVADRAVGVVARAAAADLAAVVAVADAAAPAVRAGVVAVRVEIAVDAAARDRIAVKGAISSRT